LKRPRQSTKPKKIRENIHDLKIIEEMFAQLQPVIAELRLSPEMIRQYATVALKVQIPQLARRDQKRYLYLLCFITHQYYTLQDILIDILLKVVQTAENAAKRTQQEAYFHTRTDRSRAVLELTKAFESSHERWLAVRRVVLLQSLSASQKLRRLEVLVREEDGERQATIQGRLRAVRRDNQWIQNDGDSSDALEEQSLWLQKRATAIVKHLIFNQATSRKDVIEAIVYFRGHDAKLSMDAPTAFLTKKERQVVFDAHHRLRVSLYKAMLFQHIAAAMKAGALNLTYSYRYRSLDDYLIPKTLWTQNRTPYVERAHLTGFADCEATLSDLREKLDRQFATTNTHILAGINSSITVHGHHQFTLTTPREENVAEPPMELFPQARFVSLCEVLATVQHATGFLDAFSHVQLTHTHQKPPDKVFFAGITGLGCNIGIAKLAKISIHINQAVLERAVNWYFSAETVAAANDRLLSFMERLALPRIFDRSDGIRITTSDGQKYTLDGESLTASRSYKYFGKDPGITAYTFRNNRDFLYHSTVFSPTDREAWYVVDGMMHNEVVKSDMHATDTHGATPPTFAALHFLQVFFAPRLADLPKRTRYAFVKRKVYQEKGCPILPDKMINSDIIREHWDDILRFMATIILKETQASQLFQRLNSYSHQHPLYRALKEFGQIIETVFILRYIDEENMRQAVEKELNKLEHTNKFAKAVFHGGNQEFSQETREEQLIAEGCKRLIANAIILWNYLYLSEKIADTPEGKQRRELLRHIQHSSMATWHHINLLGEYDYSDERVNDITPFHLPKILALKVA
jgi:TnpA family transposase